jgi:hypothetical protein
VTSTDTHVVTHQVRRLDVPLPQPYDEAVHRYEQLVPAADTARFRQLSSWEAVLELAAINAPHGFMTYWKTDVTAMMAGSPSGWKCAEYLMGNHTIAERMFREDPAAMLYAPLRTVIYADADEHTHLAVDQPSTLFSSYDSPAIAEVGRHLDRLLAELLAAMGATPPGEIEPGIRERLVGCWRLAGYEVTAGEGGQTDRPLGDNPLGTILYTPDGYMSAQLARPGPRADDQEPDAYYIAYSGPFEVDEQARTVAHQVQVSVIPSWRGTTEIRQVQFPGPGTLVLSASERSPRVGAPTTTTIRWSRQPPRRQMTSPDPPRS